MTIKVTNIKDIASFFEKIKLCKGDVLLCTENGDKINLKSKICQYIALSTMFDDPEIRDTELILTEPQDVLEIIDFLVRG